jgi:hypothetical protein
VSGRGTSHRPGSWLILLERRCGPTTRCPYVVFWEVVPATGEPWITHPETIDQAVQRPKPSKCSLQGQGDCGRKVGLSEKCQDGSPGRISPVKSRPRHLAPTRPSRPLSRGHRRRTPLQGAAARRWALVCSMRNAPRARRVRRLRHGYGLKTTEAISDAIGTGDSAVAARARAPGSVRAGRKCRGCARGPTTTAARVPAGARSASRRHARGVCACRRVAFSEKCAGSTCSAQYRA